LLTDFEVTLREVRCDPRTFPHGADDGSTGSLRG